MTDTERDKHVQYLHKELERQLTVDSDAEVRWVVVRALADAILHLLSPDAQEWDSELSYCLAVLNQGTGGYMAIRKVAHRRVRVQERNNEQAMQSLNQMARM